MPKRTNEFQRLIFLVRSALSDGATVTESKMLRHRRTRAQREVDICIEGNLGGYPVKICIECQKRNRIADVGWVEGMLKKHEHLPTNQLILVSHAGFTQQPLTLAKEEGAMAIKFEEVETTDFQALLGGASSLWTKSAVFSVDKVFVQVIPSDDLDSERVKTVPDQSVVSQDGTLLGELSVLVRWIINESTLKTQLTAMGQQDHRWFVVRWSPPKDLSGYRLCLQKEQPHMVREIEYIEISGPCEIKVAEFGIRRGKLDDVEVVWGKSTILDKETMFVATRAAGVDRVTVMVDGGAPATQALSGQDGKTAGAATVQDMTMYYLVDTNERGNDSLGIVLKRHITLDAALAQAAFHARPNHTPGDVQTRIIIVQAAKELGEGQRFLRGRELRVFDVSGKECPP